MKETTEEKARFPIPVFLLNTIIPAIERISELDFRVKASYESLLAVLALKQWQMEKGEYPDRLEKLVAAGLLEALPDDPYSPGALVYQRQGENFVLYSLGADFDDDDGIENPNDPWGEDAEGGDHLFWPVR